MRLIVLIDRYRPILGGAQNNVHLICRSLIAQGFDITVLTRRVVPGLAGCETIEGVRVRRFGRFPVRILSKMLCAVRMAGYLMRRRGAFDAVLCVTCESITGLLPAWATARATGAPYVVRTTGIASLDALLSRPAGRLGRRVRGALFPPGLWRRAIDGAALVVTQSELIHRRAARHQLLRRAVIANGVDTGRFAVGDASERDALRRRLGLPSDRFIVLSVGRYVVGKNQIAAIRAVEQLASKGRVGRLLLLVLGATERGQVTSNEAALKRYVRERRLSHLVRFLDDVPNVEDYLRAGDAFAFASRYPEGMSNALLEAMSCGLPLVCSDLPQNAALLPARARLLFAPDDVDALAGHLARLAASPELRRAQGTALAAFARRHYRAERSVWRWAEALSALAPPPFDSPADRG